MISARKIRVVVLLIVAVLCAYQFFAKINDTRFGVEKISIPSSPSGIENSVKNAVEGTAKTTIEVPVKGTKDTSNEFSVIQQLEKAHPYNVDDPMPKFIWQTWKVGLDSSKFPLQDRGYVNSWHEDNPDHVHTLIVDHQCLEMVRELYKEVPKVVEAYEAMPLSILKADFFRYLVLFARGGVYSDIDTKVLKPVKTWPLVSEQNAGLVVGIEADPDRNDWAQWYARRIQFCQWTIQSKRGHPMLRSLIGEIVNITLTRKEVATLQKSTGTSEEGTDIMNWTGPGIFTDFVFEHLNSVVKKANYKKIDDNERTSEPVHGFEDPRPVSWKNFTGIISPVMLDDVLVLPITSFSPGVNQMGARGIEDPMALVWHMFSGSWKNNKMNPQ